MRKKLFTLLLAMVAGAGALFAESGTCGENLTWDLTDGVLTISGTGEMMNYSSYSSIPWYSNRLSIKTVIFNDGVTSIGNYAFYRCSKLTSVTLSNSITIIGNEAFSGCFSLTSVTIPNSVTSIGSSAFSNVPHIVYNGSATGSPWYARSLNGYVDGYLVYADASKTTLLACFAIVEGDIVIPNSVTSIGRGAFYECSKLTSVTLGNSISIIGDEAFYDCSSLTSIDIPNSITNIGDYAFYHCSGLTSVTIPNNVTNIGRSAFISCFSLTSVTIGNGVTSIRDKAFSHCSSLTSITIGSSVKNIGSEAFYNCSSLTSIKIPNSVTSIGNSAFSGCSSLTSVTMPDSITSIGSWVFSGCSSLPVIGNIRYADTYMIGAVDISLSSYTIKEGTKWIGYHAFSNCNSLTSVTIPNSVISIEPDAFYDCNNLTSVTIGNGVTSIGDEAFKYCSSLTSIDIPNSVTSIGGLAFCGCSSLSSITIPKSVTRIGGSAFYDCRNLTTVTLNSNAIVSKDYSSSSNIKNIFGSQVKKYIVGQDVTSIGKYAFYYCSSLSLIAIGNGVTSIGDYAFYHCSGLNKIYSMPQNPPTIPYYETFSGISSDAIVYVSNTALTAYKSANFWKEMNIIGTTETQATVFPTSVVITASLDLWEDFNKSIVSIGLEGGEQQTGNVLDYIGLEPNSEYKDILVLLTANTGETETVNVSFTTSALELTTKPSKVVSSTTAILLAETNMSDAEVSCGFEYKRNDAPADMDGTKVFCPVASGQMAGRLKNLKDDVYYKYRAFYQSAAGNMYYGDWQYIFTGDVAVEFDPILYTYGATVVRENEATISGYALAGSEDFTEQGFEYWAESRTNGGANAPHRVPAALNEHFFVQASGIALRATLTNLDAGTVYKYRVYGKVGDQYYYGSEQSFTTQGTYEGDDLEAIEEVPSDPQSGIKAQKILRNGQIFILRGDKVYNAQGALVK